MTPPPPGEDSWPPDTALGALSLCRFSVSLLPSPVTSGTTERWFWGSPHSRQYVGSEPRL